MPVIINGSTGISGTDGSAATPAVQGTDVNTGMFFPAADQIAFSEGGTEVMRIDASGNVGIGTSSPIDRLSLSGGSGAVYQRWQNTTTGTGATDGYQLGIDSGGQAYVWQYENQPLIFATNNTERARITSGGDLQFNSGYGSVATAFGCRAWVNFNGTGTVAIRASGNVSSITDNGVGRYQINFATSMPDANYSVSSTNNNLTGDELRPVISVNETNNTSNCTIRTAGVHNNNTDIDCSVVSAAIFR